MSSLSTLLSSLQKGFLKNVLTGAGVTLSTAGITLTALRNNLNSVNADVLSLAHLAGFDIAISLVLGALVTRLTLNSTKLALKKI